ncbi:MAG: hypothetical protein KA105_02795 [Caulobacter sp.]|nr:hypothetical protein [Caulobacter sp.]
MARSSIKVEGLADLDRALGELPKATALNVLRRVGVAALEPMRAEAARLAPDDPATSATDLKDNIVVTSRRPRGRGRKESSVEVFMGPDASVPFVARKGVQQEFGNVNHGPQPFMRPSYEAEKRPTVTRVAESLGEEIEKARVRAAKRQARLIKKVGG